MATTQTTTPARPAGGRIAAVREMAALQRLLFEVEREFIRTVTALIPRLGDIELKYLLCQHVWESAGHARFLKERGGELNGFGKGEGARPAIRRVFEEALRANSAEAALAGFYRILKPALLDAYQSYLRLTHHLADWPSRHLVEAFLEDEERHAAEMAPFLERISAPEWTAHLQQVLQAMGGWLGQDPIESLPEAFTWHADAAAYTHPDTCSRGDFPVCSSVFSEDPKETPIVRHWLEDPQTDARLIRLMIYVWLMMELDAVDYLATVFYDTPEAPFDLHFDLARHLWDESRHSQFGFRQLPKLGVDLSRLEHSLDLYNILVQMSPAERYAMMTMEFEAGSFPTKARIMDRVRELNDFEADTLLAFDRNDEQNHVRYGHRWLPEIMKLFGEEGEVGDFVAATQARFKELADIHGGQTPHSLSPEIRITGEKLRHLALSAG